MTQAALPNRAESPDDPAAKSEPSAPAAPAAPAEFLVLVATEKLRTSLSEMISVWRDCLCLAKEQLPEGFNPQGLQAILFEGANLRDRDRLQALSLATGFRRMVYFANEPCDHLAPWIHLPLPIGRFALLSALERAAALPAGFEEDFWPLGAWQFKASLRLLSSVETDQEIRLTEKESAILELMLRSGSAWLSRETLYNQLWGSAANVTEHTIDSHLYRLRRKLAEIGIELITGDSGYGLIY